MLGLGNWKKMAQKLGIVLNLYWTLHPCDIFNIELILKKSALTLSFIFASDYYR